MSKQLMQIIVELIGSISVFEAEFAPTSKGEETNTAGLDSRRLAKHLAARILPVHPNGFTFCPRRQQDVFSSRKATERLYVVSLAGFERRYLGLPTESELIDWLARAERALKLPGRYIGGWRDGDAFVLDVSLVIRRLDRALLCARRNGQRALYHPASGREIEIG